MEQPERPQEEVECVEERGDLDGTTHGSLLDGSRQRASLQGVLGSRFMIHDS